jgi:hypothetical protein
MENYIKLDLKVTEWEDVDPFHVIWNSDQWRAVVKIVKLQEVTVSFAMSVCLSVSVEQLGSHWTDFHEI